MAGAEEITPGRTFSSAQIIVTLELQRPYYFSRHLAACSVPLSWYTYRVSAKNE